VLSAFGKIFFDFGVSCRQTMGNHVAIVHTQVEMIVFAARVVPLKQKVEVLRQRDAKSESIVAKRGYYL
jgi:hypothetical protein